MDEDVWHVEHAVVFAMEGVMAVVAAAGGAVAAVMVVVAPVIRMAFNRSLEPCTTVSVSESPLFCNRK